MPVASTTVAKLLGRTLVDVHNLTRGRGIEPAGDRGMGRSLGKLWPEWTIFALAVELSVTERTGRRCNSLFRYLLNIGAVGFRDAVLRGRTLLVIVNGCPMPMLVSRRAVEESIANDGIVTAAVGAEVLVADVAQAWAEYANTLERLSRNGQGTPRLEVPYHAFANN